MGRQLHEKCGNEVGGAHIKVQGFQGQLGHSFLECGPSSLHAWPGMSTELQSTPEV